MNDLVYSRCRVATCRVATGEGEQGRARKTSRGEERTAVETIEEGPAPDDPPCSRYTFAVMVFRVSEADPKCHEY